MAYHTPNLFSENEIKLWWNNKLPLLKKSNWTNKCFTVLKSNKGSKKIGKLPYGTAYLTINNTELFYNVLGGIEFIFKSNE